MKDKDDMKKQMINMVEKIGGANISTEDKVKKMTKFFELNERGLNHFGPHYVLDVKNKINDIIRSLLA